MTNFRRFNLFPPKREKNMRENNLWQSVAISQAKKCYFFRGRVTLTIRLEALEEGREGGFIRGGTLRCGKRSATKVRRSRGEKVFTYCLFPQT